MNRADWEAQVFASNMNTNARMIALVVGTFGNWKHSKTVEPGMTKIAQMTDMSRSTVSDYVDAMVEQGWLSPVGTGEYNTTVYELTEATAPVVGLLAKKPRKMNANSTKNLNKGPKMAPIPHNIKVIGGGQLPNQSASDSDSVADTTEVSCRYETEQLPNGEQSVADTFDMNLTNNLVEPELQPVDAGASKYEYHVVVRDGSLSLPNSSSAANPFYLLNLEGVTGPVNAGSRDAAQPKRILTPGEKKDYERAVRVHKVTDEQAKEALVIVQGIGGSVDIYEATTEALVSLGAVQPEAVEVW